MQKTVLLSPLRCFLHEDTYARIGTLIERIFTDESFGSLHVITDREYEDQPIYHFTLIKEDGKRQTVNGSDLEICLLRLLGKTDIPKKTCELCKETKPIYKFSLNALERDGRLRRCRECESQRIREYYEKITRK